MRAARPPHAGELALLRHLLDGPRRIETGPIGQCVKRGWCQSLLVKNAEGRDSVVFALTEAGREVAASRDGAQAASAG